jgi:hypothetical protein
MLKLKILDYYVLPRLVTQFQKLQKKKKRDCFDGINPLFDIQTNPITIRQNLNYESY